MTLNMSWYLKEKIRKQKEHSLELDNEILQTSDVVWFLLNSV